MLGLLQESRFPRESHDRESKPMVSLRPSRHASAQLDMSKKKETTPQPLSAALLKAAIDYEEKTAAVLQSALLLKLVQRDARDELREAYDGFAKYLQPHRMTVDHHFTGLFLFSVVAQVEYYFVNVLRILIKAFPKKLGSATFRLSEIVDASLEELALAAAEEYLTRITYRRPAEYLDDLASTLSIETKSLEASWAQFVECKARRDLGIHNDWRINAVYRRKVAEVGLPLPPTEVVSLCPDFEYFSEAIHICDDVVRNVREQLTRKYAGN